MASNEIGDEGAKAIAQGLQDSQALEQLDLQSCGIGADGSLALGDMLKTTQKLKVDYFEPP